MLSESATTFIAAAFVDPDAAERAIGALRDHGVNAENISVAMPGGPSETYEAAHQTSTYKDKDGFLFVQTEDPPTPTDMNSATDDRRGGSSTHNSPDSPIAAEGEFSLTTTTAADAARGAVEGSLIGLGIGVLAGVAALTLPGVGLILAAGPLWAALGGAAAASGAGAVAGSAVGYLRDMGVSDDLAVHHTDALTSGSIVVTVQTDARHSEEAISIVLQKYGGATSVSNSALSSA